MDAVALAMVEALPTAAPTVGWGPLGALPSSGRYGVAASVDATRIYVTHGILNSDSSIAASGVTINPATGVTTALPVAPAARKYPGGVFCNGKHYVIGGYDSGTTSAADVYSYTPAGTNGASGVWSTAASLPAAAAYPAVTTVGNFIYAAGGIGAGGSTIQQFVRYDTTTNTWTSLANLPNVRWGGSLVAFGSKLYYISGQSATTSSTTVNVFDVSAGTWSTGTALPGPKNTGPSVALNGTIYVLASTGSAYLFDGTSWATVTYTYVADHGTYAAAVAFGNALVYISGNNTSTVEKYDFSGGSGYATAVLGVKSLLDPLLAGVGSALPNTPPTDTTGKAAYAQTVQTLKALAAL